MRSHVQCAERRAWILMLLVEQNRAGKKSCQTTPICQTEVNVMNKTHGSGAGQERLATKKTF